MAGGRTGPGPGGWFYRLLYRIYARGSRTSYFFLSRISPLGWGLIVLVSAAAIMGTDIGRSGLYQIFTFGAAALGISLVWAWIRRARLAARRHLPQHATVGQECRYTIEVINKGRGSLRSWRLWDRGPDPRPDRDTFLHAREPGEEKRNAFDRLFVYYRWEWLLEGRLLFRGGQSEPAGKLARGEKATLRLSLVPRRRGVALLNDLRVQLPDPLGLFQRCRLVEAPAQSLVVLPKRYRLPPLNLPGSGCMQLGGESGSNTIGNSSEFLGLREYRSGDSLRHVHWKAWARTGEAIVKEFEDTYFPRYGLVLDNCVDPGDEDLFEESVSVAASFAAAVETDTALLDLMFVHDRAVMVSVGRGLARAEKMLEVLAGVEGQQRPGFQKLAKLVGRYADGMSACLCVFTGWSEERANFLRTLIAMGLETVTLVVCRHEQAIVDNEEIPPPSGRVIYLEQNSIQEGLLRL